MKTLLSRVANVTAENFFNTFNSATHCLLGNRVLQLGTSRVHFTKKVLSNVFSCMKSSVSNRGRSFVPPFNLATNASVVIGFFDRLHMMSFAHNPTNQCCDSKTTHHDKKTMWISAVLNHRCMLQSVKRPHIKKGACPKGQHASFENRQPFWLQLLCKSPQNQPRGSHDGKC